MSDNKKFYAAVSRMIRAAYRRAESADPEDFHILKDFPELCRLCEESTVNSLRSKGYTWEHIGQAFGLSRQAAFNRWGRNQ